MGTARRERIYEWDILRTMAFAGVVLQHLLGAMARRLELGPTGRLFCAAAFEPVRFAVPMFVFLFGCALFYVHPDGVDYKSYLKKRMMQLAVPYVLWSLVYLLYAEKPLTPGGVLGDLLRERAGYHLWYVVMILQFVLVTPVFYAARRALRGRGAGIATAFGVWLVFLALAGGWPKLPMCFVSWLGFFVLGALCGADCARFSRAAARLLPLTGAVYFLSMGYAAYRSMRAARSGPVNFSCVSFLRPGYAVFTLCGILFWYAAARRFAAWGGLRRLCAFVGAHSYEAYLAHVLVLSWCSVQLLTRAPGLRLGIFYTALAALTLTGAVLIGWGIDTVTYKTKKCLKRV